MVNPRAQIKAGIERALKLNSGDKVVALYESQAPAITRGKEYMLSGQPVPSGDNVLFPITDDKKKRAEVSHFCFKYQPAEQAT